MLGGSGAIALAITGGLIAARAAAPASEPAPAIEVVGPCGDATTLERRLAALSPEPTVSLTAAHLQIEQRDEVFWARLRFEIGGTPHERTLSAESCEALLEASALVIGLSLGGEPPDQGPADGDDPPPASGVDAPPDLSSARPAVRVGLGGGLAVGILHVVHPLLTAGVGVKGARWYAGVDALYLVPRWANVTPEIRTHVQMVGAAARGCPQWSAWQQRLEIPVCAGLAAGLALGRGEGASIRGRRGRGPWVAATVGPRLRLRARWGGDLWIATELVVPLLRLNFIIDSIGPACCELPLGVMIGLGGAWSGRRRQN